MGGFGGDLAMALANAKSAKKSKNPKATAGTAGTSVKGDIAGSGLTEPHSNLPFSHYAWGSVLDDQKSAYPKRLEKGRITEAYPQQRNDITPFHVYFMFNPTEVRHDFAFDTSQMPATFESPENLKVPNLTSGGALGFALLFDRMFEVANREPASIDGSPGPGKIGTLWDVHAFERLLNVFVDATGRPSGAPTGRPVIVDLGRRDGSSITFQGFINSVSITHAIFSADMTPTRTRIDLSITQTFLAQNIGDTRPSADELPKSARKLGTEVTPR